MPVPLLVEPVEPVEPPLLDPPEEDPLLGGVPPSSPVDASLLSPEVAPLPGAPLPPALPLVLLPPLPLLPPPLEAAPVDPSPLEEVAPVPLPRLPEPLPAGVLFPLLSELPQPAHAYSTSAAAKGPRPKRALDRRKTREFMTAS
jgi:hypothetical protein